MKLKFSFILAVALICATLVFVSCKSLTIRRPTSKKRGHGPPPHAPAHGYRYKQHGVELVYDSGRGVYVVVNFPNHFYGKGYYYRLRENKWEVSVNIGGPWEVVSDKSLPPGLRGKKKGRGKPKGNPGRGLGLEKKKNKR